MSGWKVTRELCWLGRGGRQPDGGSGPWWVEVTGTESLGSVTSGWVSQGRVDQQGGLHLQESHLERFICRMAQHGRPSVGGIAGLFGDIINFTGHENFHG